MPDDLHISLKKIEYLFNVADGDEDIAGHLIGFSLSKIIEALAEAGIEPSNTIGIMAGPDVRLRLTLRRFQETDNFSALLSYLLLAYRFGQNVLQIDEEAWLASLNFITNYYLNFELEKVLLFDKPLDFVAYRERILENYPDSSIIADALNVELRA